MKKQHNTLSKSPKRTLLAAHATAQNVLPLYSHRFSPHKFTLAQLFACLVLKTFVKTDYRGIETYLRDLPDLGKAIGLKRVPHFTTLQKASEKLLRLPIANRLLLQSTASLRKRNVKLAAMDSTGLQAGHISRYFVRRKRSKEAKNVEKTHYKRFPKLELVGDCRSHLILGAKTTRGPSVDINRFCPLLEWVAQRFKLKTILADAGYDSEKNHRCAREKHHVKSIIPAVNRTATEKTTKQKYRRQMQTHFARKTYGQRWQVETIVSMFKRRFGDVINARSYWAQNREMMLLVLTFNLALLLLFIELFYRADLTLADAVNQDSTPYRGPLFHVCIHLSDASRLSPIS